MICKKAMKIAMGVGMVLCATASFAARTQDFESGSLDTGIWTGDGGTIEAGNPSYAKPVGAPIATAETPSTKTLLVEGEVICANTPTADGSSVSDFLIFIPEPSDELDDEGLTDAKIAIAAGTAMTGDQVPLCLYCKTNGTDKGWGEIGAVSTGTWVRVTLAFTNGFCRVSIDGEPAKSSFGYTAASDSAAPTGTSTGAWYKLAGTGDSVLSLSFIGCAKLDDVVIKDSFADDAFPATAVATLTGDETVRYNDLNKWGWTVTDLQGKLGDTVPGTGMTVAQKLLCGLDPTTTTKFEPLAITPTGANTATIRFPCEDASKKTRYELGAEGGTAVFTGGASSITVENGVATAGITLAPDQGSKVVKFWLKAKATNVAN